MKFTNNTPFPAMSWKNFDKDTSLRLTTVVRVKYLFDNVDEEGHWQLKLDPQQGSLRRSEVYYDTLENQTESSIRFENDYVPYKPHADFVINAYAHSTEPLREWRCGVKVLRPKETEKEEHDVLIEKWLRVRGERYIQRDVIGSSFTTSNKSTKVPVRYEYANGGSIANPEYDKENNPKVKPYIKYASYNPIGVGITHNSMFENDVLLRAPQIESMQEVLDKPNMPNPPQGFGFMGIEWQPRASLAGTYDEAWLTSKAPVLPDDYQDTFNNTAHPDMQLKSYFEPQDKIVLHNLIKDRYVQSFEIPNFYFQGSYLDNFWSNPFYLSIDSVVVDILEDDMQKNAVYISYRSYARISKEISESKLTMLVPKDFLGATHG